MNSLSRNEVAVVIVEFLRTETNFDDPALINDSTKLLELGVIDSLMMMSLVTYCEELYGCHFRAEDLTEESLENALNLADLVLARSTSGASR
jgi:acyl carrier protein